MFGDDWLCFGEFGVEWDEFFLFGWYVVFGVDCVDWVFWFV